MAMQLASVDKLLTRVQKQLRYPEMYRLSRELTEPWNPASEKRPVISMEWLSTKARSTWPTFVPRLIKIAIQDIEPYYASVIGSNPRESFLAAFNQFRVLRMAVMLDRNLAFAIQMQQAYMDATRTHQETFFNTQQHQEIHQSLDTAIRGVAKYLWDR